MTTVFLSYSHQDRVAAREFSQALRNAGLDVWLDEEQAVAGESIASAISEAISRSDVVVALLSTRSQESNWLSSEVAAAIAKSKKVIPVLLDRDVQVPLVLRDRLWLDLSDLAGVQEAAQKIAVSVASRTDPSQELRNRADHISVQRAEMEREFELAQVLREQRERELRSRSFTVMFALICAAGAGFFYFLDRGSSQFNFLWLAIGILVGAGTAQISNYLRLKSDSKLLEREAKR